MSKLSVVYVVQSDGRRVVNITKPPVSFSCSLAVEMFVQTKFTLVLNGLPCGFC